MATTATAIRNAIVTALGGNSDGWTVTGSNGLQIVIVSPVDGPNALVFINPTVTGGGDPNVSVTQTLGGIDRDETFEMWIYTRENINLPKEKHTVSFVKQVDGFGRQLFITDAINTGSDRSNLIRVNYNTLNVAGQINGVPIEGTPIYWLSGGDNGILPTNADIAAAWESSFKSRRKRPLRVMVNAGHSSPTVQQKIDSLCQRR